MPFINNVYLVSKVTNTIQYFAEIWQAEDGTISQTVQNAQGQSIAELLTDWRFATQNEIDEYIELPKAKQSKLQEVSTYYNSREDTAECWNLHISVISTPSSNVYIKNDRSVAWWKANANALYCGNSEKEMYFFDKTGLATPLLVTPEAASYLTSEAITIENDIGYTYYTEVIPKIQSFKTLKQVEMYDFKKDFEKINRLIKIDMKTFNVVILKKTNRNRT